MIITGVDELGFTLALLTVGMSMVAARTRQLVASLGASALWSSLLAYILANTTAGLNWQGIFIISAGAFIIAMLMFGVLRRGSAGGISGINWRGVESGEEAESKPSNTQITGASVRQSRSSRHGWGGEFAESPEEYQARVRSILRPRRRRR